MKKPSAILLAVPLFLGGLSPGCVHRVTYRHEPRQPIRFTSATAAQTFYEAYLAAGIPKGHGVVSLSIPLPYSHRTIATGNVQLNAAAKSADSDRNGTVTGKEAHAYANSLNQDL